MIEITPKMCLTPITALAIAVICYASVSKKTTNRILFRNFILSIILLGFLLNFIWEILHSPLYQGYVNNAQHIFISVLASVADVIMLLLLYFVFVYVFKNPYWVHKLSIQRIFLLILVGGTGATLSEFLHVSAGDWVYAVKMPLIPFVNAGLSPVLQFAILPISVYWLSFYLLKTRDGRNTIS